MEQVSNNGMSPLDLFKDVVKKIADANPPKTTPQNTIFEQDGSALVARNGDGLVVERYCLDSDGKIDWHSKNEYDENGNMIRTLDDSIGGGADGKHPDGVIDYVTTYEYDENGNMTRSLYDGSALDLYRRADGVIDSVTTYEYDENGNMIRKLQDNRGGGADGKHPDGVVDKVTYYIRNEEGEITHHGYDEDANGAIDRFRQITPKQE